MRLNQVAVWVVARASHTSSVRPDLLSSSTKRVAKSATSSSTLLGTRAKMCARFGLYSWRLLCLRRRAQRRRERQ